MKYFLGAVFGYGLSTVFVLALAGAMYQTADAERIKAETEQQRLHFDQSKFIIELQLLEGAHAAPENRGSLSPSA